MLCNSIGNDFPTFAEFVVMLRDYEREMPDAPDAPDEVIAAAKTSTSEFVCVSTGEVFTSPDGTTWNQKSCEDDWSNANRAAIPYLQYREAERPWIVLPNGSLIGPCESFSAAERVIISNQADGRMIGAVVEMR